MDKKSKIYIAGASGMVGSAIIRNLTGSGFTNLVGTYNSKKPAVVSEHLRLVQTDLTRQDQVETFFKTEKPDYVFLAAAKVGGIHANNTYPGSFIYDNLIMQSNVIHAAHREGVKRLLFLGSSCIYPRIAPQPMQEEHLLTGLLEPTNEPYAVAKIAGIKMCESYNRQYGTRFMAVMPTNLYGPNDNFDLENSHVLPALLRRFHEAKKQSANEVVIWGTGKPRREFLFVDDMAEASVFTMNLSDALVDSQLVNYPKPCFVNVGAGVDCTIMELAQLIKSIVGFGGSIRFDTEREDGTPQKLLDISRLKDLGWEHRVCLESGIRKTYEWYLQNGI